MWWCQFIDWLRFETRPISLLNFGKAHSMDARQYGGVFFAGSSKMTPILSIPYTKSSQLSHKERSTAKAFNENLKVSDIER